MSTTPVFTALPASKVGIAFGPPMKLICSVPLPSALNCCDPLLQVLHVDAVLGEGADEPQRRLLRARRGRGASAAARAQGRQQDRACGDHGRRFSEGAARARGRAPTLPRPRRRGQGVCLELPPGPPRPPFGSAARFAAYRSAARGGSRGLPLDGAHPLAGGDQLAALPRQADLFATSARASSEQPATSGARAFCRRSSSSSSWRVRPSYFVVQIFLPRELKSARHDRVGYCLAARISVPSAWLQGRSGRLDFGAQVRPALSPAATVKAAAAASDATTDGGGEEMRWLS